MSTTLSKQITADYDRLRNGAVVQMRPDHGVLLLSDIGRTDFLQRMTTNDILALAPGTSTITVLTSDVARSLFAFTVICRDEDLLLLPGQGEAAGLAANLRGKIFFMDKVQVGDISQHVKRARLMGRQSDEVLARLGIDLTNADDGAWRRQGDVTTIKQVRFDVPGYELLIPAAGVEPFLDQLQEAGATVLQDDAAYQARRIELGRPVAGSEITDAYNPLEVGLEWTCAENKGCYTGQEIIARQITYDKVTKTLVGLRSEELLPLGAPVSVEGRVVGTVTSTAISPALDVPVALAIIKRPANAAGTQVEVGNGPADVTALPFLETAP